MISFTICRCVEFTTLLRVALLTCLAIWLLTINFGLSGSIHVRNSFLIILSSLILHYPFIVVFDLEFCELFEYFKDVPAKIWQGGL